MAKKLTKLQKSTAILNNSIVTEWKYVNVNNEFEFMNIIFKIDDSVEEYKVHNKAREVEDFTNEAYMEEVLISLGKDNLLRFYNQNYDEISQDLVAIEG